MVQTIPIPLDYRIAQERELLNQMMGHLHDFRSWTTMMMMIIIMTIVRLKMHVVLGTMLFTCLVRFVCDAPSELSCALGTTL